MHRKKFQGTKTGKVSRYLNKNPKTFDALSHENLSNIPVLKDGTSRELQVNIIRKSCYFTRETLI